MEEEVHIQLNNELIQVFELEVIENANDLIQSIKVDYESKICTILRAYCDIRGDVYYYEIEEDTIEIHNSILSFYLTYDEHVYMGCKDYNYVNEDQRMLIEIKQIGSLYSILGEERAERTDML